MSRSGGFQGYGAVREYRDDPNYQPFRDQSDTSYDEESSITRNISEINNRASVIEKAAKAIGTDRDNGQAGDRIHHVSQETHKLVTETTRLMKRLGGKRLDRKQKLQLDKVKNDFQDSVQRFQSLQKRAADKVKTAQRMEKPKPQSAGWLDTEDDHAGLVADQNRREALQAQEQVIDNDLALIQEREDRIRELEADILDVNEIFRDLGAMVYDQGEQIDTIEANVEKAYTDVEQGTEQLQKASTYQQTVMHQSDNPSDNSADQQRQHPEEIYCEADRIEASLAQEQTPTEQPVAQTNHQNKFHVKRRVCCILTLLTFFAAIAATVLLLYLKKLLPFQAGNLHVYVFMS